ncbi:MAG: CapA family protein [Myxococcaceae bacterium]
MTAGCATTTVLAEKKGASLSPAPEEKTVVPAAGDPSLPLRVEPAAPARLVLPPVEDLDPDAHHAAGLQALSEKNGLLAAAHLKACTSKEPSRIECAWELGWAYYLLGAWPEVVAAWEQVEKLNPAHPDVAARLAEARGQVELRRKLDAMAAAAPDSVRTPPPEGTTVRLRAVGDVMLGSAFPEGYLPPEEGAQMLAGVKDLLLDAELTFINLEGPLCDTEEKSKKCRKSKNCYAFRTPTAWGRYLAEAGVDLASTANNHSGDFDEPCRRQTEATLDALGIAWSGPPGSIATVERNGMRIAMVAFHTSPATNDVNDHDTAVKLVEAASATHDLVIVSFHGGAEGAKAIHVPEGKETFFGENRGELRAFTHKVVDAGADLVLGHGPHVLRAMEIYNDRLIAYSLGNFATYGRFNLSGALGIGVVLEAVLDAQGRFVSGKLLPTKQVGEGVPEKDPAGTALDYVRLLSTEDFPETGVLVDREGNIAPRPKEPVSSASTPPSS